jgi:hypothetical protein
MEAWRRRVWIDAVARLRRASLAPWVAFTCWVVFAAAQEPSVLRQSGVFLREPAAWTGAAILWMIFALQKTSERFSMLDRFATLGVIQVLIAASTSCLLLLANLRGHGEQGILLPILGAGYYLVALTPVALAAALGTDRACATQIVVVYIFRAVSLGPSVSILPAASLAAGSKMLFAASGLSICASLLLMIAFGQPRHLRRPARSST